MEAEDFDDIRAEDNFDAESLPSDYETCGICGFDHTYDESAIVQINQLHQESRRKEAHRFMEREHKLYHNATDLAVECCSDLGFWEESGDYPDWMLEMAQRYFAHQ